VQDKASAVQLPSASVQFVVDYCRDHGLIVGRSGGGRRYSNTIALSPPLIITRGECDKIVDTLDRALTALAAQG
jgi:4-aminobutyrate aminotransferase-like enzyme